MEFSLAPRFELALASALLGTFPSESFGTSLTGRQDCNVWEPVDHLQRSLGPEKDLKLSEKSLPGPPAPGPPESLEKVSKNLESLKKVSKRSRKTFSRLGDFFTLLGFRARRARETSVNRQWVPHVMFVVREIYRENSHQKHDRREDISVNHLLKSGTVHHRGQTYYIT